MTLKFRAVGTSGGLILPKELLAQLGWKVFTGLNRHMSRLQSGNHRWIGGLKD